MRKVKRKRERMRTGRRRVRGGEGRDLIDKEIRGAPSGRLALHLAYNFQMRL